jgi:hypothetical protein
MVSKPDPDSAWIRPPSWLAATKKSTPPVASSVASAWTASATLRTPATPIDVLARYQTDPKWLSVIALRDAASSRSLARPTLKSCPIRCDWVKWARVSLAHEPAVDANGVEGTGEEGLREAGAGADGDGSTCDGCAGPPAHPAATPAISRMMRRRPPIGAPTLIRMRGLAVVDVLICIAPW